MKIKEQVRKIRDEEDAKNCLQQIADSGLSTSAWCRENGIHPTSIYWWSQKLARQVHTISPRMVEVTLPKKQGSPRYRLQVGDVGLVVGDGFDSATLKRLIQVLRSC
jgi:transposase-like protein